MLPTVVVCLFVLILDSTATTENNKMSDSDEEEDILVMVEFDDLVPACTDSSKIKIIGLDTVMPIVQYEKQVFKGEWKENLGTKMLFAEKDVLDSWDPAFSAQVSRQYECAFTTRKVLQLKSVVLCAKDGNGMDDLDDDDSEDAVSDGNDTLITDIKTEPVDVSKPGTSFSS